MAVNRSHLEEMLSVNQTVRMKARNRADPRYADAEHEIIKLMNPEMNQKI